MGEGRGHELTADGDPLISVVIPARDAAHFLGGCLRALESQNLARSKYEIIVAVDTRSRDDTATVARSHGAIVVEVASGPGEARNEGVSLARGEWIAFTDADCIPTRGWLRALLGAVDGRRDATGPTLGAAGSTLGFASTEPAARFVDLAGGLHNERYLAHTRYPWASPSNAMYRRAAVLAVGGFDPRLVSYEGCDLHTRLRREVGGRFTFVPQAVVYHHHRPTWRKYWRQQESYGRGYAQFFRKYGEELEWSGGKELQAWLAVARAGVRALPGSRSDAALMRRGTFVKQLAQRVGFLRTYWRRSESARWRGPSAIEEQAGS